MTSAAVIYEVRLRVDNDVVGPFDAWLAEHVDDMLRFDGFETAESIEAESPDAESSLRIVRYRVASRAHLQNYLDEHAPRVRAQGIWSTPRPWIPAANGWKTPDRRSALTN